MSINWGAPIPYTYRDHELMIKLKWSWPGIGIPESAMVLYADHVPGDLVVVVQLYGPWRCLDQAMSEVILAGEFWVDCRTRRARIV